MAAEESDDTLDWVSSDGLTLYGRIWRPQVEPMAVVCLVHGLGEHSGRYEHVSVRLTSAGYAFAAFDLRGHGRSGGPRGHAQSYQVLMNDIADFLTAVRARYPQQSLVLYGQSLGGNLAMNFALRRRPQLSGVVATAPALRAAFEPPAWKLTLAKLIYNLWPALTLSNELDVQAFSRDPQVLEAYRRDPLVHDRLSARLAIDLLEAGSWALDHASEFPLPLLLMHGSGDRVTSSDASREFGAAAGAECDVKIWDGLYHEIHNEPEKEQVLDHMLHWLERRA